LVFGGFISGQVTRSDIEAGFANVGVAAWINAFGWPLSASATITDVTGRYILTGLDPGCYFVSTAAADGG
jgi:hypothetical protein